MLLLRRGAVNAPMNPFEPENAALIRELRMEERDHLRELKRDDLAAASRLYHGEQLQCIYRRLRQLGAMVAQNG